MNPVAKTKRRLTPPSPEDAKALRGYLKELGYTLDILRGELGFNDLSSFRYRKYLLAHDEAPTAVDIIVQWFTCGMPVSVELANRLIPDWVIALCERCGLLTRRDDSLIAMAMLTPFKGLLIASDLISKIDEDASDLIVWPNSTTQQMLNAAIRRPGQSMLDLGCGMGLLSVACRTDFTTVTATDLNSRAAEFTEFNANLNEVGFIECLCGDAYETVAGRTFDLILCNPPFFLMPSTGLLYCENPMELDGFARALMRQAPAHLNEGGFFQMLCEWVDVKGQTWKERLQEWAEGLDCDVWILKTYTMTPIWYGKERCEQRPGSRDAADAAFANWIRYYREKGVTAVHGGLVTLRKRTGKTWVRLDEDASVTMAQPVGEFLLECLTSQDLSELSDEQLLETRLLLSERSRLRQFLRRNGSKWNQSGLALTMPGTLARELELQPPVAEFAGKFDGTRTLRELTLELAATVDADPHRVTEECVAVTRKLLERGFLSNAIK